MMREVSREPLNAALVLGVCRKDDGVMCPSYVATRDENDVTRGRAHALFEMMRGDHLTDGWNSEEVKQSLDLCPCM